MMTRYDIGIGAGLSLVALAVIGLIVLVSLGGCSATGIQGARETLPKVHSGLDLAARLTYTAMEPVCRAKAKACARNGKGPQECPGWLKCHAVRTGVESSVQAAEDALRALNKALRAAQELQQQEVKP